MSFDTRMSARAEVMFRRLGEPATYIDEIGDETPCYVVVRRGTELDPVGLDAAIPSRRIVIQGAVAVLGGIESNRRGHRVRIGTTIYTVDRAEGDDGTGISFLVTEEST